MKTTYKISFGILIILFLAYLVLAQTTNTRKLETGRIVVSTGTTVPQSGGTPASAPLIITDFIPLPKGKCDVVISLPPWGALQITTLAEAKNTTTSRNIQTCAPNTGWGGILCDAKINLDDEYYLMRIDFANPVPYFTVNYQCKTL